MAEKKVDSPKSWELEQRGRKCFRPWTPSPWSRLLSSREFLKEQPRGTVRVCTHSYPDPAASCTLCGPRLCGW